MANIDTPFGLKYKYCLHGGCPMLKTCFIPSGDGTAVFIGDLVKDGGTSGGDGDRFKTVAQAAASNAVMGVVVAVDQIRGISLANKNLNRRHRPASTGMYVSVIVDPMAVFEIQCDDDTDTIVAADIGSNANIIVGSGSTVTGMSGMELDSDTRNTTGTLPLKIFDVPKRDDNTLGSAQQKVHVILNNHQLKGGTGTDGTAVA